MSAFALTSTGDLDISTGRLKIISDGTEIAQKVAIRLQFFRGEWLVDLTIGLPFFEQILIKNPSLSVVKQLFREAIETCPGIASVDSLDLSLNNATRTLSVTFTATTDTGTTLDFSKAFVVPTTPGSTL